MTDPFGFPGYSAPAPPPPPPRQRTRGPAVLGLAGLVLVGIGAATLGAVSATRALIDAPIDVTTATPSSVSPPEVLVTTPSVASPSPIAGMVGLVASLVVKGNAPMTGYDRDLFAWNSYDFDRNGCDQRNDVLRRDLTEVKVKPGSNGCRVESGVLQDRYTGTAIPVTRDQVEIDHAVPLGNAWVTGAATWSPDQRKRFANDPLNLVATQIALNRQKGAGNAATWLPPKGRCDYVARQAAVKHAYGLSVTAAEQAAMLRVLAGCPDQPIPTGTQQAPRQSETVPPSTVPPSTVPPSTVPTRPPGQPSTDPRFRTCREAKANGYGPYVKGEDPEYEWYDDRDRDGIVCE